MNPVDINSLRVELFFSSIPQLKSRLDLYQLNKIKYVNMPCKKNTSNELFYKSIDFIHENFPSIFLTPHFSIQHQYETSPDFTLNKLVRLAEHIDRGISNEILLISGSTKRKFIDSVSTLDFISESNILKDKKITFGVAFNPYLPEYLMPEERRRIRNKIYSGLVTSVWLQFGTDIGKLKKELKWLKTLLYFNLPQEYRSKKINIIGSIFLPSRKFSARFRFRPWKGVYISDDFLNSPEYAFQFIKILFNEYKRNNIEAFIETEVSTTDHINQIKNLIY